MEVREMHIEFEQIYQNVAANIHRGFDDAEKDWLLNRAVERFVDDRVKPHRTATGTFQLDSKTSSDLNSILDDDNFLPVDKYSTMVYKALLPGDFRYLINARPYTLRSCDKGYDAAVVPTTYYYGQITIPKTGWYANAQGLGPNGLPAGSPYSQVQLILNGGTTIFDISNYTFSTPLVDAAQRFVITDLIRDVLSEAGFQFYWEKYNGMTVPNTLFFEQGTAITSIQLKLDNATITGTVGTLVRNLPKPYTLQTPILGNVASGRWTRAEDAYDLALTPFFQSMPDSPLITYAKGHLKIFGREPSFIVTQCIVDYIRNPRKINLSLDRSCDLPEHTHKEICGIAAELAFLYTQRPDWERKVQDNTMRI